MFADKLIIFVALIVIYFIVTIKKDEIFLKVLGIIGWFTVIIWAICEII